MFRHWICIFLGLCLIGAATLQIPYLRAALADEKHSLALDKHYIPHEKWSIDDVRHNLEQALTDLQTNFFETWLGKWPTSIDWTGAVIGTHVAATLSTLTLHSRHHSKSSHKSCDTRQLRLEDLVNKYFAQLTAYYFGENAFAIRTQAHDDMLWVVLGWLESLKLIGSRGAAHNASEPWHGALFKPAFAHRSRIFYEIVSKAWDREICSGGLTWNPSLGTYKNAVTNTQFVSAAVGMYLFHPGDEIRAPFMSLTDENASMTLRPSNNDDGDVPPAIPHDPEYLAIAVEAHDWIQSMKFTNERGLFIDGFHVQCYSDGTCTNKCDVRDEMVWTYNQGVILSGRRQLWEATGNASYLDQGHELLRNVIRATGFPEAETGWRGLGYSGILTEFCDSRSTCNQDAHTFKGIFFHHLAAFCEPLPTKRPLVPDLTFLAEPQEAEEHTSRCSSYISWVELNAKAAWSTRNEKGVMGAWWGAPAWAYAQHRVPLPSSLPAGARQWEQKKRRAETQVPVHSDIFDNDLNDRGRGRTVESHSGGLAVLRALYALRNSYR